MEVITTQGEVRLTRLQFEDGVVLHVRAPGMHVEWRSVPTVAAFTEAMDSPNEWSRAIAANELAPFAAVEARPLGVQGGGGADADRAPVRGCLRRGEGHAAAR